MKVKELTNVQTACNNEYSGTAELWANEKYLINYNRDLIGKFTKDQQNAKDVLEFGAGIGTLALLWLAATGIKPECLELDPKQQLTLKERGLLCFESLNSIEKKFDTIYTSNVLEHIEDDQAILSELNTKLKDGGRLIVYVPAFNVLYSDLDAKIGHFRRYHKGDLLTKLRGSGFEVIECCYSDSIGFFAWLYLKIRGYSSGKTGDSVMALYDKFVFPLSRLLDAFGLRFLFGKNLLVYAQKSKPSLSMK